MPPANQSNPQQVCEAILSECVRYNLAHQIWPSENVVANRMLSRGIELRDAYAELCDALQWHQPAIKAFLDVLLGAAAVRSPAQIRAAWDARKQLVDTNQRIATMARELAALLDRRTELHNKSGFSGETHYHVCDVIRAAAKDNHGFRNVVDAELKGLQNRFDLKYWPDLSEFMEAIADDAQTARPQATDPITAAATDALRPSGADAFRALFAALDQNSARRYGQLPASFKLSDKSIASFANVAFDAGTDELVDSAYVKGLRQRERNKAR